MKRLAKILLAAVLVLSAREGANAAQYTDSARGYSVIYPDTWHALTWANHPREVTLRNFPEEQYLHGGNVPFGGAETGIRGSDSLHNHVTDFFRSGIGHNIDPRLPLGVARGSASPSPTNIGG